MVYLGETLHIGAGTTGPATIGVHPASIGRALPIVRPLLAPVLQRRV